MVSRGLAGGFALFAVGLAGCDSPEVKACHAAMQASQQVLVDMDKDDPRSVQDALSLVTDVARDRRLVLLEASIIVLILLEIVLSLVRR